MIKIRLGRTCDLTVLTLLPLCLPSNLARLLSCAVLESIIDNHGNDLRTSGMRCGSNSLQVPIEAISQYLEIDDVFTMEEIKCFAQGAVNGLIQQVELARIFHTDTLALGNH